jgi:hypothetical protein
MREEREGAEAEGETGGLCGSVILQLCTAQQVCVLRD